MRHAILAATAGLVLVAAPASAVQKADRGQRSQSSSIDSNCASVLANPEEHAYGDVIHCQNKSATGGYYHPRYYAPYYPPDPTPLPAECGYYPYPPCYDDYECDLNGPCDY